MSQNNKDDTNIPLPILIDFTSLNNPQQHDTDQKYEITETAARLSNQLVKDYPRLVNNEKMIISCFEQIIEKLGRFHHNLKVRLAIATNFDQNTLVSLIKDLTGIVNALRLSKKVSEEVMGVIKDVADGYRINLN